MLCVLLKSSLVQCHGKYHASGVVFERVDKRIHGFHRPSHGHVSRLIHASSNGITSNSRCGHKVNRRRLQLSAKRRCVVGIHIIEGLCILCGELLLLVLLFLLLGGLLELVLPVCVGEHARVIEVEAIGVQIDALVAMIAVWPRKLLRLRFLLTRLCSHILLLLCVLSLLPRLFLLLLLLHRDFLLEPPLPKAHMLLLLLRRPGTVRMCVRMRMSVRVLLLDEWRIGL